MDWGDPSSLHIQIIPLQGQDFAQAQAGSKLQQEAFMVAVLLRLDEKPLHLFL